MDLTLSSLFSPFPQTPTRPAFYDAQQGAWQVFSYEQVQRVLFDHKTFSSNRGGLDPADTANIGAQSILDLDPPHHGQLRSLVSHAFTPRMVNQLKPWITDIVRRLLDTLVDQGKMDVIEDLATRLPGIVIARLIGAPSQDHDQLQRLFEAVAQVRTAEAAQAYGELLGYFRALVEERGKYPQLSPQMDLISELLAAQIDGQRLSLETIITFCIVLYGGGIATTQAFLGNTFLCLCHYPEAMAQLYAAPSLLASALEEVLRFLPPVPQVSRIAAVDTVIDGQEIKAGQWVITWITSANRDGSQFPQPHVFDIGRTPNRHLSFGSGIHFCLGSHLARLEVEILCKAMLERLTDIQLVQDIPLELVNAPLLCGVKHLPITFKRF